MNGKNRDELVKAETALHICIMNITNILEYMQVIAQKNPVASVCNDMLNTTCDTMTDIETILYKLNHEEG